MVDFNYLERMASQVRRDIIRQVHRAQSGHPGGSLGCADLFTILFFEILDLHSEFKMNGHDEDVFILSNGHISPVYYSILARRGFFPVDELKTFRQLDSRLQGHPATHEGLPGIRIASGSLGQGLSVGIGLALAKKIDKDHKKIFVLMGDGELQEGQIWEAAMFAAHHKMDNLIGIVDWNGQQIDGPNDSVISLGDLEAKWAAFGWQVKHMDGHDFKDMNRVLKEIKNSSDTKQPTVILMKTDMGKGVDFMEGTHAWHGKAPNDDQTQKALDQLDETFGDYPI